MFEPDPMQDKKDLAARAVSAYINQDSITIGPPPRSTEEQVEDQVEDQVDIALQNYLDARRAEREATAQQITENGSSDDLQK